MKKSTIRIFRLLSGLNNAIIILILFGMLIAVVTYFLPLFIAGILGIFIIVLAVFKWSLLALEEQQKAYETIFEGTQSAMFLVDIINHDTFRFVNNNRTAQNLTGLSAGEINGKTPEDILGEKKGRETVLKYKQCIQEGCSVSYKHELELSNGYKTWYITLNPVFDKNNRVKQIIGAGQDVTEFIEAEESLRIQKNKLQDLLAFRQEMLDTAVIWINLIDSEGNITFWNKAAEQISGYRAEEVLGHARIWDWIYPCTNYRAKIINKIQEIIQKGEKLINYETQIKTKNGAYRTISWHSNALDYSGNKLGTIALGADITEYKIAENELREKEEKLNSIYQNAPLVMMILDENKRIKQVNDYATYITGKSPKDSIDLFLGSALRCPYAVIDRPGITKYDFAPNSHCEHQCKLSSIVEDTFLQEKGHHKEEICITWFFEDKRQTHFYLASATKLCIKEEPMVLLILQDISDRKSIEKQLESNYAKMEALSKRIIQNQEEDRARLARELHDEVGQALTAVKLDLQMLNDEILKEDNTREEKLLKSINLVDETLECVRRQSGSLRPPALDDLGLIDTVKEMVRGFENRTKITTSVVAKGFHTRLTKDLEIALFRCIQEALTNVVRHARASNVTVELSQQNQTVFVAIKDDGTGFAGKKIKSSSDHTGLAGMQERVELLGGEFNIISDPGEGTAIYITVELCKSITKG